MIADYGGLAAEADGVHHVLEGGLELVKVLLRGDENHVEDALRAIDQPPAASASRRKAAPHAG